MKPWRKPFDQASMAVIPAIVIINRERCKGCGFCVEFCPKGVLEMGQNINAKGYYFPTASGETRCLGCGLCEVICPDFAISIITTEEVK
ncbi:MAG: 4Fe-4S binding protein [Pseudomonadota bacterium]